VTSYIIHVRTSIATTLEKPRIKCLAQGKVHKGSDLDIFIVLK